MNPFVCRDPSCLSRFKPPNCFNRGALILLCRRQDDSPRSRLSDALIATGMPFQGHGDFAEWSRIYGALGPEVAGIRRFGAASLDLAWLAAGRFDGF